MPSLSGVIGGLAERYATALYELADEAKCLDTVADEVTGLRGLITGDPVLAKLVRSPLIAASDKQLAMAAILQRAGAGDLVQRFVAVVARNGRLFVLPAIIDGYLAELARRRGEVRAQVSAAQPLTDAQSTAVQDILRQIGGQKVTMDVSVDPSLIAGVIIRVGSRMIDSSIKSQLQRMQLAMKGAS